ncbi:MAG: hypothetical protein U1E51_30835 [Candidatus Binatia bacterium]|nr:hypothetical protein [Candidatus Binatia bacterium]
MNANDVHVGFAPQYAADNIVIEILVSGKRQHDSRRFARPASEQSATDTLRIEAGFVVLSQRFGVNFSRLEIRLNLRGPSQIVTNDVVHIG